MTTECIRHTAYLNQNNFDIILKFYVNSVLCTNILNDVTAALFLMSFSQLPTVKKDTNKGATVTSLRTFVRSNACSIFFFHVVWDDILDAILGWWDNILGWKSIVFFFNCQTEGKKKLFWTNMKFAFFFNWEKSVIIIIFTLKYHDMIPKFHLGQHENH